MRGGSLVLALGLSSLVGVAACTKVRDQPPPEPLPAVEIKAPPTAAPTAPRRRVGALPLGEPDAAASGPSGPVANVQEGTLNGNPEGLKRDDVNKTIQGVLPSLASCFGSSAPAANMALSFDADPSGKAQNVKVSGASGEAANCVADKLSRVPLPTFQGEPVGIRFPLNVYRPTPPPAPPAPVETPPPAPTEAPPPPPPTFIQP